MQLLDIVIDFIEKEIMDCSDEAKQELLEEFNDLLEEAAEWVKDKIDKG